MEERKAKILIYDLEITPTLGWVYGQWDTNVIRVEQQPYLMSFSYRWYGTDEKTVCRALPDTQTYKLDPRNDKLLVRELWELLNEADLVIAHNANRFDNKVAAAFFLQRGLYPPSPYKTIDTLQVAKRYFRFGSNSLNNLGEILGLGQKTQDTHGSLWYDCVLGDKDAWDKMKKYNDQDVNLLEKIYEKLRPWISNHPNMARIENKPDACPKCGSHRLIRKGQRTTNVSRYFRYKCKDCKGWCSDRTAFRKDEDIKPSYVNFPN